MKHMILAAALLLAFTSQACAYSQGPTWGVGVTIGSAPPPPPPRVYGGYPAGYAQGYAQGYARGATNYYYPPPPPPPVYVYKHGHKHKHWHDRHYYRGW